MLDPGRITDRRFLPMGSLQLPKKTLFTPKYLKTVWRMTNKSKCSIWDCRKYQGNLPLSINLLTLTSQSSQSKTTKASESQEQTSGTIQTRSQACLQDLQGLDIDNPKALLVFQVWWNPLRQVYRNHGVEDPRCLTNWISLSLSCRTIQLLQDLKAWERPLRSGGSLVFRSRRDSDSRLTCRRSSVTNYCWTASSAKVNKCCRGALSGCRGTSSSGTCTWVTSRLTAISLACETPNKSHTAMSLQGSSTRNALAYQQLWPRSKDA